MSITSSSTRQNHIVLGGGLRYETVELVLSAIPNFELKQKGRILHLFAEIYNVFIQEIQEALDERQNNLDSPLDNNQVHIPFIEPFAFESQLDTATYDVNRSSKSTDVFVQPPIESENNKLNETAPLLLGRNTQEDGRKEIDINPAHQETSSWTLVRNPIYIKREAKTPPKTKRRQSKLSSDLKQRNSSSMRQVTMTQLFDPVESPRSTATSTPMKQEPQTPNNDTMMFMPESLIGLAQPSESISENENEQNNLSDLIPFIKENKTSQIQSFKRKYIPSPVINSNPIEQPITDEDENIQNEALLESPYSSIENEQLFDACPMCRNYWLGLPEKLRRKENLTCRHRKRPIVHTPEHFWSLGIPSTQTCIERGYGGVLPPDKPIERPRRPRRQHQRKLQEWQQQQENNDEEE